MKLYYHPVSTTSRPVLLFIQENNLKVDTQVVDLMKGEHVQPAYTAINPSQLVPVLEDDPYGLLGFEGDPLPSLYSLDPEGVIYLGSFSKTFAPGFRVAELLGASGRLAMAEPIAFRRVANDDPVQVTGHFGHERRHLRRLERGVALLFQPAELGHEPRGRRCARAPRWSPRARSRQSQWAARTRRSRR